MLRRDPQSIVNAHLLDPDRRELYVEGIDDREFLSYLVGTDKRKEALIIEIDLVDLPVFTSNKQRVLALVATTIDKGVNIRGLVDSDFPNSPGDPAPPNVWKTDHRAVESYLIRRDCLAKALHFGLKCPATDPAELLASIEEVGRVLAALRVLSEREDLKLPFQEVDLQRHLGAAGVHVEIDARALLQTLMQRAGVSLTKLESLLDSARDLIDDLRAVETLDVVHGKDAVAICARAFVSVGERVSAEAAEVILRCSFERAMVVEYPNLAEVVAYLVA
jgi:uncharacterized protein DUF4435